MRIGHRILSGTMAFILAGSMALSASQPVMASGNEPVLTDTESQEKSIEDLIQEATENYGEENTDEVTGIPDDEHAGHDHTHEEEYAEEETEPDAGSSEEIMPLYSFDAETTIDGLKVHVTAPEGVFPAGSSLHVGYAQYDTEETDNLALEYALDISILDEMGQAIEPDTTYGQVSVQFESDLIANENLSADVCHVVDGVEKKMELVVNEGTATTETDSFSVYILRFTYGNLEYVLNGGGSIAISDILNSVGLTGTLEGAVSSNPELFAVDAAEWTIRSLRPFTTREKLTVTLDGIDYVINVTDDGADAGQYAVFYDDGTLVFQNDNATDETLGTAVHVIDLSEDVMAWADVCGADVKTVKFRETFTPHTELTFRAAEAPNLEKAELANLDMSEVTSMTNMFAGSPLKEIDMTGFDASPVTAAQYVFAGCQNLETVKMSGLNWENLIPTSDDDGTFNYMFASCANLKSVDMSYSNMPRAEAINMFVGCTSIETLDMSNMTWPYVTPGRLGLNSSKKYKTVSFRNSNLFTKNLYYYSPNETNMNGMFQNCQDLTSVDMYNSNFGYVSSMNNLCTNCSKLEMVCMDGMKAPSLTSMSQAFAGCSSLTTADFNNADFENLSSLSAAFASCMSLEAASFQNAKLPKLTSVSGMFIGCPSLKSITFEKASLLALINLGDIFGGNSPTALENISFKGAELPSLQNMSVMLRGATKLKYLDMSSAYLPSLVSMTQMCNGCTSLNRATFENMQAPNLKSIDGMFFGDSALKYVSFKNANMGSLSYISGQPLFSGCASLNTIDFTNAYLPSLQNLNGSFLGGGGLPNLKTVLFKGANLTSLRDMTAMLRNCPNLEVVSFEGTTTGNITSLTATFENCQKLAEFRLEDLSLANLEDMTATFSYCPNLKTINCGTVGDKVSSMDRTFMNCRELYSVILPDGLSDARMTNTFFGAAKLQRIKSPSEAPRFNTSYSSSLPVKEWKHEETQESIPDFWNDTETTLTGWFVRGNVTELNADNIDEIEYDPDTKTIHMYITSDKDLVPCPVYLPGLSTTLDLNPNILNKDPVLKELMKNAPDTEGLKLTLRTRTYSDIMSCAESDNVIWTFDVPKTNTEVIRFNLYKNDTDVLAGYVENTADALDIFTLYDASGNALRTLEPNARLTYTDIGYVFPDLPESTTSALIYGKSFSRSDLDKEVYPPYQSYISYNPEMNNYEAFIAPGKYRIEMCYPEYEDIDLTLSGIQESEPDEDGNTIISMYTYQTDLEAEKSKGASASLFNVIKQDPVSSYYTVDDAYNYVVKRSTSGQSLNGAVFGIQSLWTGIIYELPAGGITFDMMRYYMGRAPLLYEFYKVWEIQAPEGYYSSSDTVTLPFYADHREQAGQVQDVGTYIDGISITKDIINEKPCATCSCYIKGYYYAKEYLCLCRDFSSTQCRRCGVGIDGVDPLTNQGFTIKDMPFPTLSIQKKDSGGQRLPGAVLQLLDKETGDVVGEWTTPEDTDAYVYRFNMGSNAVIPYGETRRFTVHEKTAPAGYEAAADVDVTISYNSGNVSVTMTDTYSTHEISISKTDIHGEELEGAQLSITGTERNSTTPITPITWTSGAEPHKVQIKPGTYTLHETRPPEGNIYESAEDIEFTVDVDGTVTVDGESVDAVTMVDKYYEQRVFFKKVDTSGNNVPGATLTVTGREDGSTTDIEPQTFDATATALPGMDMFMYPYLNLRPGTYTVEETETPEGYAKADDITFVVDKYGDVYVNEVKQADATVVVTDKKLASIQLTKYDSTKTEKLGGAEFDVYKGTAGTEGAVFKHFAVNANGTSDVIEGFEAGTYYILETKAPEGHALNDTPLEFTITEDMYDTTVQLEMTDEELLVLPEAGGSGTSSLYIPAFAVTFLFMALAVMAKRKLQTMA